MVVRHWWTELFKPRPELWKGEQIEPVGEVGDSSIGAREVGDSSIGAMDAEGSMEQNGDKNDTGTVSHYPGNHYVDSRLLDTGR